MQSKDNSKYLRAGEHRFLCKYYIRELGMHGFGYSGVLWVLESVLCTYLVMAEAGLFCYRLLEVGVWQMDHRA